jgi:hypothetical protein
MSILRTGWSENYVVSRRPFRFDRALDERIGFMGHGGPKRWLKLHGDLPPSRQHAC